MTDPTQEQIAMARVAATDPGQAVMEWLVKSILHRTVPPEHGDRELWHHEGQRSLVLRLLAMAQRGKGS
jgi:hypothetical protein